MLAAAVLAIFVALGAARLAAARARPPLAPALAGLRRPRRPDVRRLAARTSGTSTPQVDTDLTNQARIEGDLTDLVDAGAFEPLCGPIAVPNHRAVPRLAFGLDVKPTADRQRQRGARAPAAATSSTPASPFVIHNFILDPNDPTQLHARVPPGFGPVARNESWMVYRRC